MAIDVRAMFEAHADEYLKFEDVEQKLSTRPDLHAFIKLNRMVPGTSDIVAAAGHDEIYLDVEIDALATVATEADIVELARCGVLYDSSTDGLAMFV